MCALKVIILFHFVVSVVLITPAPRSTKRVRLTANKKAFSEYQNWVSGLVADKSIKRRARHLSFKNNTPTGKMKVKLFCRTGFLLEILGNGRLAGTRNLSSEYAVIEMQVFGHIQRRLKGVASGRYLSLSHRGKLTTTRQYHRNRNTLFNEKYEENHWISYSSSLHIKNCVRRKNVFQHRNEWFIAIKKNGSLRRPCRTEPGMHSTQFVALGNEREAVLIEQLVGN